MKRIAKFHKVSFEQFAKDWKDTFEQYSEEEIRNIYDSLKLPKRATTGSAGYDFYAPVDVTMKPGEIVKIPTGIRVEMEEGWVLKCYPRSGSRSRQEPVLCRGSLWNTESPWMTMQMQ